MTLTDPSEQGWQKLTALDAEAWTHAREQCHWAMQVVAAVGYAYQDLAPDDSQSNAGWVDGMQLLAGRMVSAEPGFFVSLRPSALELALHHPDGTALDVVELHGRTLQESFDAVSVAIRDRMGEPARELTLPDYELDEHALRHGGRFEFSEPEVFAEFSHALHDANLALLDLHKEVRPSTTPRVWPHHFDMGMLISLEEDGDPQHGRSLGVGWSPGEPGRELPYWYVNPYPAPTVELPSLAVGRWQRDGFTGAVLDVTDTWAAGDAAAQEALVRSFLEAARSAGYKLLQED